MMKRLVLVILTLLITAPLWAAVDKGVSWLPPTERVNGDPLSASEIQGYDLECLTEGGAQVYATGIPAGDTSHTTAEVFEAGSYFCRMRTIDTDGLVSDWGQSAVFTVGRCETSDCRPMPPRSITVEF
jgi:hypothetical protein